MNMTKAPRRPRVEILVVIAALFVLSQSGCAPTYPKEIVDEAIVQLCREEYKIDVKVKILGKTVGVYIPLEGLFDMTLNISKEASDKINDVLLSVSRVTLSTDAPLDFYIVIAQDPMLPEIEVVLLRYVVDLKMLHYDQISRGEFGKRMIISIKLTPQAQKEKVLRDVFSRLNIEEADNLISEYLSASEVMTIGDIGYWNDTFFMKDIEMGEFLAMQIADRIKLMLIRHPSLKEIFKLNSIKGDFLREMGRNLFRFSFEVAPLDMTVIIMPDDYYDAILNIWLGETAEVLHGYKFDDFWNVEIVNSNNNQVLYATPEELEDFRKKKIKLEEFRRWYK